MKFKAKSETTRQYIIETTADIFNKKGYAGTSMSDLTEATKLTKGSIYGNFGKINHKIKKNCRCNTVYCTSTAVIVCPETYYMKPYGVS